MQNLSQQPTYLHIEIKNKQPIELADLTKSLVSLASQFDSFAQKHGSTPSERQAKLYVKEIKTGSVILDLYEALPLAVLPFLENANTVIDFAKHLKNIFDAFLGRKEVKEIPLLTPIDYKELSTILAPIAKDSASQLIISPQISNNSAPVELTINIGSIEANGLQNKFRAAIEREQPTTNAEHERVLFYWYQAKSDFDETKGNKGKVESITKKALNVIFENDDIKQQMLRGENNPLTHAFVVDVNVETIGEKPMAYKILRVHDIFPRDDD